jgi:hypothetical protein
MKAGGVIAFHVTNRFLDLAPVVKHIAAEDGLAVVLISDDAEESNLARTDWVLVTREATSPAWACGRMISTIFSGS